MVASQPLIIFLLLPHSVSQYCDYAQQTIKMLKKQHKVVVLPFPYTGILRKLQVKMLSSDSRRAILWGFDPDMTYAIDAFPKMHAHYDCIDYLGRDSHTEGFSFLEKRLMEKAATVSFNSLCMQKEKMQEYPGLKKKSIITVSGCAFDLFSEDTGMIPKDVFGIKNNKALLAGIFDYRIDGILLHAVMRSLPFIQFVFIGPVIDKEAENTFSHLDSLNNFWYLGEKKKQSLPEYYHACHVGIIPYNVRYAFTRFANPMKAYEYLAAGLPVVSTEILALKEMRFPYIAIAKTAGEFSHKLERYVKKPLRDKTGMKRIAFHNSWEKKIQQIIAFIQNYST